MAQMLGWNQMASPACRQSFRLSLATEATYAESYRPSTKLLKPAEDAMRPLFLAAILTCPSFLLAQEAPKGDIVVTSATSSTVRVADMNETVVVNGRLLRVADLLE